MNIAERNEDAKYYVSAKLRRASELQESDFPDFSSGSPVHKLLTELIEVHAKGFRGIVLTALVGLHLNTDYDPLNDFYGCNPRAIFEEGIWYALTDHSIPCGKSDPLNVAKNISQLDEAWAKGKRPESAALAAVTFLRMVMANIGKQRTHLIDYFFFRLLKYSQQLSQHAIVSADPMGESASQVAEKLINLCLDYPESGSIPQFVVAKLLTSIYALSPIHVNGGDESVFGTNTTSKKPADMWTSQNNDIIRLYEVTVKKVSLKRLDDCLGTLQGLNVLDKPVTFICRIPEDTSAYDLTNNTYLYKGKVFDFIDIRHFILVACMLLTETQIASLLKEIQTFVASVNISPKTKQGWNLIFQQND